MTTQVQPPIEKPNGKAGRKSKPKNGKTADKHEKLSRNIYEKELHKLQIKLCHLQEWVKQNGTRVIVVLEGRGTAGKRGFIRVLRERVGPGVFRVVALTSPRDEARPKLFLQRY